MSQVSDVGGGRPALPKARASQPRQPASLSDMSDGDLADEHRGHSFAKRRADDRIKAIEAELDRRLVTSARGKLGAMTKHPSDIGLIDLRRLRADHPDLCRRYAQPSSDGGYWRTATLAKDERP